MNSLGSVHYNGYNYRTNNVSVTICHSNVTELLQMHVIKGVAVFPNDNVKVNSLKKFKANCELSVKFCSY